MTITLYCEGFWPIGFDLSRLCILQGASLDFRKAGGLGHTHERVEVTRPSIRLGLAPNTATTDSWSNHGLWEDQRNSERL